MATLSPKAVPAVPESVEPHPIVGAVLVRTSQALIVLAQATYWYGLGSAVLLIFAIEVGQSIILRLYSWAYAYLFWRAMAHQRRPGAPSQRSPGWRNWLSLASRPASSTRQARIHYKRRPASAEAGVTLRSVSQARSVTPDPSTLTQRVLPPAVVQSTVREFGTRPASFSDLRRITEESLVSHESDSSDTSEDSG